MKKVLVIFYSFAPQNNCAAIPNTKLIKYLEHEDVNLTLITNSITPDMELDEALLPENLNQVRRYCVQRGKLYLKTVNEQRKKITESGLKLKMKSETRPFRARVVSVIKHMYFVASRMDWERSARRLVREKLKDEHFDLVYSSYPALSTHHVAEYVRNKKIADKWIADFRDPICYDIFDSGAYRKAQKTQFTIERKADHITIVSEDSREKFLCPGIPSEKITYIPNGYDPEDYLIQEESLAKGDQLRFFYAGTLYGGKRDMTPLFHAIQELIDEGVIDRRSIRVEYAGNEWPIMKRFAERFELVDICKNYGFITRQRVMELMGEIDCSIVSTQNTQKDKGVVTGKLFELLLVGKPIVAIVSGDISESELGKIIKECSAGIVCEEANGEHDYLALKQWVKNAYLEKMENGYVRSTLDKTAREEYSYARIANKLYTLMECVVDAD